MDFKIGDEVKIGGDVITAAGVKAGITASERPASS
jgi:hypothetical protein